MRTRAIFFVLLACLLAGCGQFDVQIETPTPRASATPIAVRITLTATGVGTPTTLPTPSPRVFTATPQASATPSRAPYMPGAAVKIIKTHMTSIQAGWAIGEIAGDPIQRVLVTADGGKTWSDRTPDAAVKAAPAAGLTATAEFSTAQVAWVAFAGREQPAGDQPVVVWSSTDGGATWNASAPLDLSGFPQDFRIPSDLGFNSDGRNGWLLVHLGVGMSHDYVAAFTSADGGRTWKRVLDPTQNGDLMGCTKSGLLFTGASNGWLAGNCPGLMPRLFLYTTSNGGNTWIDVTLPVPGGKPAGYFSQDNVACGLPGIASAPNGALALTLSCVNYTNSTGQSWLYTSGDGGATWTQRPLPALNGLPRLLASGDAFLVGTAKIDPLSGGGFYRSSDGGATWTLQTSTTWTGTPDFTDAFNGWVVATHDAVSALVHTVDGGRTWQELRPVMAVK